MLEKILNNIKKMFKKIIDKTMNILHIKRKIKYVDADELFEEFINSDIWESTEILKELKELTVKAKNTWIMQEFDWNSFSLEIYQRKVIIINNFNNNIAKIEYWDFVERIKKI